MESWGVLAVITSYIESERLGALVSVVDVGLLSVTYWCSVNVIMSELKGVMLLLWKLETPFL